MRPAAPQPPFPARFSALAAIRAVLAAACDAGDLGDKVRLRAELAVEELLANTIHHGYGGESDHPVWVAAQVGTDGLEIDYQDAAPAFDPFAAPAPAAGDTPEAVALGGLGRLLVRNLAGRCGYRRLHDRNRITLVFPRDATAA